MRRRVYGICAVLLLTVPVTAALTKHQADVSPPRNAVTARRASTSA